MASGLLIASIDRAGDHVAVLGVLVLIAAVGGLIYGLVHLLKSRTGSTPSDRGPEPPRGPEA